MNTDTPVPDATLYIATGCSHCPAVLQGLSELLKQGTIGRLEVTNITVHPEVAREQGIRSVPWTRIGPFRLPGRYTPGELRQWAERAGTDTGLQDYLAELLENQRLEEATNLVIQDRRNMQLAIAMLADLDTPMGVRIGIGAILEDLAAAGDMDTAEPHLRELLQAEEPQVRADAAYYLGLSRNPAVREWLRPLLQDEDGEVREIVQEALAPE